MPFPHDHEWKNGKRGTEHLTPSPDYSYSFEPLIGIGLIIVGGIGTMVVAVDNITGIGAVDDYLLVPFSETFRQGLLILFG